MTVLWPVLEFANIWQMVSSDTEGFIGILFCGWIGCLVGGSVLMGMDAVTDKTNATILLSIAGGIPAVGIIGFIVYVLVTLRRTLPPSTENGNEKVKSKLPNSGKKTSLSSDMSAQGERVHANKYSLDSIFFDAGVPII
jgi:hypothetical protein